MADGIQLNLGSGGDILAADDVAGHKHQRVKLEWGPDSTVNEVDDASGKRVPVKVAEALPAGTALLGLIGLDSRTSGGLSIFRSIDLDESEEAVKATPGQVYGWYLFNLSASMKFVKFYNGTVADVTVGSTTPVMTIPLPPGAGANVAFEHGLAFSAAITVAATTGVADSDTGAPGANEVVANIFYK